MSVDKDLQQVITNHYQGGYHSIQTLARTYNVSVDDVLEIVGEGTLSTVQIPGDLIDQSEAGPGAEMNYGRNVKVPFSVD